MPLRNQCCAVRKVNPLTRALRDYDAWITGLRRDQTPTRAATPVVASDPGHDGMTKIVPLAAWSRDQVWDYLREHGIRQHPLYARGYMSIGCAPCTRATQPGEQERARRWWWESDTHKECLLHPPRGDWRARARVGVSRAGRHVNARPYYPIFLDLHERHCVVLGDTRLADEKARALQATGADIVRLRRPVPGRDLLGCASRHRRE